MNGLWGSDEQMSDTLGPLAYIYSFTTIGLKSMHWLTSYWLRHNFN